MTKFTTPPKGWEWVFDINLYDKEANASRMITNMKWLYEKCHGQQVIIDNEELGICYNGERNVKVIPQWCMLQRIGVTNEVSV